jgi:hypothetical protein
MIMMFLGTENLNFSDPAREREVGWKGYGQDGGITPPS